ncbi:hypothetical protein DB88DRAFT_470347 [Papiliotrema laurentii]|uniref:Uncharacterized protein n=1 Tax=Papiliotrema laurentii TaxID=5418 RepID=A0AAD9FWW5_PAPLA|nr:hypothetical protein DB88DRAFT_470347 [Papiliotrema laurentii]
MLIPVDVDDHDSDELPYGSVVRVGIHREQDAWTIYSIVKAMVDPHYRKELQEDGREEDTEVEKVAELYVKSHRELGRRWNTSKPDTFPPVENDPDSITITFGPGHQNHLFHALGTFIPAIEAVHKYRGTEGNRYLSESEMEELRNAPTIRVSKSPKVFSQTQQATKMWRLHPTMRSLYNSVIENPATGNCQSVQSPTMPGSSSEHQTGQEGSKPPIPGTYKVVENVFNAPDEGIGVGLNRAM